MVYLMIFDAYDHPKTLLGTAIAFDTLVDAVEAAVIETAVEWKLPTLVRTNYYKAKLERKENLPRIVLCRIGLVYFSLWYFYFF